ncbi:hypothetical protein NUW54_g11998 [Trametes sanguinea]|uniref:Uncharacterized protein n=1 Tax=Trametes sanguinea TaxID=158606 RepID=A0ACC1N3Y9_9APHY|nr:hypothetical protein NUW54_g11998 [Trametes sanguinea]
MPPLNEGTRQLSGESTSSDGSSRHSTFGFNSRASLSSTATTTAPSPSVDDDVGRQTLHHSERRALISAEWQ